MAVTYEPIASTTLGSNTSPVTFSDIPGTYTDLVLVMFVKTATVANNVSVRFNSDSGSNYSYTTLYGPGDSSAGSTRLRNETYTYGPGALTTDFCPIIMQVMSYANTNVNKTVLFSGGDSGDAVYRNVGLWRSTAAITSISLYNTAGSLATSSVFSLYGIKAA